MWRMWLFHAFLGVGLLEGAGGTLWASSHGNESEGGSEPEMESAVGAPLLICLHDLRVELLMVTRSYFSGSRLCPATARRVNFKEHRLLLAIYKLQTEVIKFPEEGLHEKFLRIQYEVSELKRKLAVTEPPHGT